MSRRQVQVSASPAAMGLLALTARFRQGSEHQKERGPLSLYIYSPHLYRSGAKRAERVGASVCGMHPPRLTRFWGSYARGVASRFAPRFSSAANKPRRPEPLVSAQNQGDLWKP